MIRNPNTDPDPEDDHLKNWGVEQISELFLEFVNRVHCCIAVKTKPQETYAAMR